ncbi:HAMP domain-containing sensor histidine kinase [Nocardiopsis sp. RSe5-2]|uniref:histidine kinase n=1 Tax=Nocardiopsis endophytica TaxID=3018445 RepID=A0ABT4TYC4_9ACTN|nr:HAMP domain-containing sensor histidine kinase [Nocardiopsis endophytica]MDA2809254.1 HAMP domain-containing sensor histidine kinase [Nocardiopsis endophytica]
MRRRLAVLRRRAAVLARYAASPERWRLGTKFAAAFAVVAAAASLLTGTLAYSTASVLIRTDAREQFQATAERLAADVSRPAAELDAGQTLTFLHSDDFTYPGVTSSGSVAVPVGADRSIEVLPVRADDRAVAAETEAGLVHTREDSANGEDYRIATVSLGGGRGAIQIGQRLSPMERMLDVLALQITVVGAGVLVVAAGAGWLLARRVTKRLVRLTDTAEQVRTTGRLDLVAPEGGASPDEVGRLGRAFNAMLTRLAGAEAEQRRLVQNASHELRTPLTSLRTNVSVMRSFDRLGPDAQQRLVDDLQGETRELSKLVDELVQLATGTREDEAGADVELGPLAERVADRARRRTGREVVVDADGSTVHGRPTALERALSNPVENAAKFDTESGGPIEIVVREGRVEVRDRGPGIAPEEVEHVFERFYRSDAARALPGSGLGLSMVKEIVHAHGGTVFAANREGGGAIIGFTLPTVER